MWLEQLEILINNQDLELFQDLLITYEAETNDSSLQNIRQEELMLLVANTNGINQGVTDFGDNDFKTGSGSIDNKKYFLQGSRAHSYERGLYASMSRSLLCVSIIFGSMVKFTRASFSKGHSKVKGSYACTNDEIYRHKKSYSRNKRNKR